jgi:hypothetical protein
MLLAMEQIIAAALARSLLIHRGHWRGGRLLAESINSNRSVSLTAVGDNPGATLQARQRAATSASLGRPSRNIPITVWRNYGNVRPETHLTYMINICLSMAMLDACGGPDGNTRFRSG